MEVVDYSVVILTNKRQGNQLVAMAFNTSRKSRGDPEVCIKACLRLPQA